MNGLKGLLTILAVATIAVVALAFSSKEPAITGSEAVDASSADNPTMPTFNLSYQDAKVDGVQGSYCSPVAPFTRKEDFQNAVLYHVPGQQMAFFNCDGVRLYLSAPNHRESTSNGFRYLKVDSIENAWKSLEENGADVVSQPRVVQYAPNHNLWMAFFNDTDGNTAAIMSEVPTSA